MDTGSSEGPGLRRRTALVTGASKGLGAAIVSRLAQSGYDVALNFHTDVDAAAEVADRVASAFGSKVVLVQGDVTSEGAVSQIVQSTLAAFGGLDVVVNNANITHYQKSFVDLTWAEFETKVAGELRAAFLVTRETLAALTASGAGRLIYISSEHADGPIARGMISSGTAKAAINTFAKYIAHEVGRRGITANVVQCGMMRTAATRNIPPPVAERIVDATPVGFIAEPDDVATTVAYLASLESRYVTGAVIPVTGGFGISRLCPPEPAPHPSARVPAC